MRDSDADEKMFTIISWEPKQKQIAHVSMENLFSALNFFAHYRILFFSK
jgi:hypothetical protein